MTWFRYVKHGDVPAYLEKGWVVANNMLDTHHGRHAILMRWAGEGEPE